MPEFKTTAKGVDAPFVKRTVDPVEILGTSYDIHFTKGEGDKGWRAFASADISSANASGKTLDGAVLALRSHMEDVAEEDAPTDVTETGAVSESAPVAVDDTPEVPADGEPVKGEDAHRAPEVPGSEAAAMIGKAVKEARDAYGAYTRGEMDASEARRAAGIACTVVADMSESARLEGLAEDVVTRLYTYGIRIAEHYCARTGGGRGGALTDAQRSRAFKKFRKVCGELVTAA